MYEFIAVTDFVTMAYDILPILVQQGLSVPRQRLKHRISRERMSLLLLLERMGNRMIVSNQKIIIWKGYLF
jgi:hypothetical protein